MDLLDDFLRILPAESVIAEQTAMRFARETGCLNIPTPQRRFGASVTETAHRLGYPSLTLGANTQREETFLRCDTSEEANDPGSLGLYVISDNKK